MNILDYLPNGFTQTDLMTALAAVAAFVTVVAVWQGLVVRDPMAGRARSIRQHQENLKSGLLAARRSTHRHRNIDTMGFMRRVTERLNLMKGQHVAKLSARLAQAGWRSKDAMVTYLFFKLAMPFVFGGVALVFLFGFGEIDLPGMVKVLIALVVVIIGAYAPELMVRNTIQKRYTEIQKGLPDALDLLVICAEAGLSLDAALTRVSDEVGKSAPEVADEFSLAAVELGFLPERRKALDNLTARVDLPAVRGVVNTLLQTEKYGTPLASSLRVLSAEFRTERMLKAEEKAAKLPATLTVPLIAFVLPTLFVVLIGPAVLSAIDGLGGL